jgi:hypothetical protein
LPDDAPLPLRSRGHHVRQELPGGRGEINAKIERHDVPSLRLRSRKKGGEVNE